MNVSLTTEGWDRVLNSRTLSTVSRAFSFPDHMTSSHANLLDELTVFIKEFNSHSVDTNMLTISLFWDTNMLS